jgi:hypothetical protein
MIDGVGTLSLPTALFAVGLFMAIVAAFIFLQANDVVVSRSGSTTRRRRRWVNSDHLVCGVPVDRFEALAAVSAAAASVGLIAAAALTG